MNNRLHTSVAAPAYPRRRAFDAIGESAAAGSAMGHLDLALWLFRTVSPGLSSPVSRYLLADIRTLQAPYAIPNHLAQADPLIQRFEQWARGQLKSGASLHDAAKALATSTRSLQRRCREVLGKSPLAYFQDLRVERVQSLLQGNGLDLEAIAAEIGDEDGATLRTLLRQRPGTAFATCAPNRVERCVALWGGGERCREGGDRGGDRRIAVRWAAFQRRDKGRAGGAKRSDSIRPAKPRRSSQAGRAP